MLSLNVLKRTPSATRPGGTEILSAAAGFLLTEMTSLAFRP
jgi:hypothetical protein